LLNSIKINQKVYSLVAGHEEADRQTRSAHRVFFFLYFVKNV